MNVLKTPLVSVVIPTYNHAHFLGRALQSVLNQSYTNWEVIIIDNHSTDNTDEVVQNFADPRISLLKINNNGVIAASRNAGIVAARGEWVALLDSDDWWTPNKLQVCLKHTNEKVGLIYHRLKIVKQTPALFRLKTIKSWQLKTPVLIDLLVNGNAIANSSVVVRKKLLSQISGIDENKEMIGCEDYNTWLRIAQITEDFYYIPQNLGFYMEHDSNSSHKDMSVPLKCVSGSFVSKLNVQQRLKYDSHWKYSKGRFAFVKGDFVSAKQELSYCLRYGSLSIKFKSAFMLMSCKFSL